MIRQKVFSRKRKGYYVHEKLNTNTVKMPLKTAEKPFYTVKILIFKGKNTKCSSIREIGTLNAKNLLKVPKNTVFLYNVQNIREIGTLTTKGSGNLFLQVKLLT